MYHCGPFAHLVVESFRFGWDWGVRFFAFFSPFPWWQIGPPWLVGQELEAVVCVLRVETFVLTAPSGIAQWKFENFCLPFARDPSLGIHWPLLCFG